VNVIVLVAIVYLNVSEPVLPIVVLILAFSAWLRMWQCQAHTPGRSACTSTV